MEWGAALASTLPETWAVRLVILASPVMPSGRQLADALAGTRFERGDVHVIHLDELDALVDAGDPHAVLLSLRGPFVRVVAPILERRANRPALLSGFPGLTIPAVPKASSRLGTGHQVSSTAAPGLTSAGFARSPSA